MRRSRREVEEHRVAHLLARLGAAFSSPPESELRALARAAAATPRPQRSSRRRLRLRFGVAVSAALLAGSGLGFGLGAWNTATGNAGTNFVGVGFLPAQGWTVVQSDSAGPTAARSIAANVRLHPHDRPDGPPRFTLATLPPDGVVIHATLTFRGDPAADVNFPVRRLPLRFSHASPASALEDPVTSPPRVSRYRVRAGVGTYNVDAWIYFGSAPSAAETAAVQHQLDRLVVSSDEVTIVARPAIASLEGPPIRLFGSLQNGRAGEVVTIQAKECGVSPQSFRDAAEAHTEEGGSWSLNFLPGANATLRAVWKNQVSAEVAVRQRPRVQLVRPPRSVRRFEVAVVAKAQFWRKRVSFQRFERRLGRWTTIRSVVLTETGAAPGSPYVWSSAKFRASVPSGTLVRAVFPLSQARPCYLGAVSKLVRT